MIVSSNELQVTIEKACVGCGLPRGVARELAAGQMLIKPHAPNSLLSLVEALDNFKADTTAPKCSEWQDGWTSGPLDSLEHCSVLADLSLLAGLGKSAFCERVDFPTCVLACVVKAEADWRCVFAVKTGGEDWQPVLQALTGFETPSSGAMSLKLVSPAGSASEEAKPPHSHEVDDSVWSRLGTHAAKILVPADDQNRADAGAGLTDND